MTAAVASSCQSETLNHVVGLAMYTSVAVTCDVTIM